MGQTTIHIPTIFLLIVLLSLSLGAAIRLVSSTEPESGLKQLADALLLHGVGYVCFIAFAIVGPLALWLGELCVALFFFNAIRAIALFRKRALSRWTGVAIVAPILTVTAIFSTMIEIRIILNGAFLCVVELYALHLMLAGGAPRRGRGRHLVVGAIILNLIVLAYRDLRLIAGLSRVAEISDPVLVQALLYCATLVGLVLFSIGFVLMSKERTDAENRDMILKDRLTGLWNRRKLEEVGRIEMGRLVHHGTPVSLMLIDLDDFKGINDRFGHAAGDVVLTRVAEVCGARLRATDVFGRWGGEEFMVLLPGTGVDESLKLAESLRRAVQEIVVGDGHRVSISIGVSLCLSSDDWRTWFERADVALYRAKSSGKNRSFFEMPLDRIDGQLQIRWCDELKVGIDEVDDDHRRLIDDHNQLLRFMAGAYDKGRVFERLMRIEASLRDHCDREERLIESRLPARLPQHRAEHVALAERFRFLVERFEADTLPLDAVAQFLVFEMCAEHIARHDRAVFRDWAAVSTPIARAS